MKSEVSAGGVVVFGNAILLLRKYNGDWVLPKGRVERGETLKQAAKREVREEGGVKGEVVKYVGKIQYSFRNHRYNKVKIIKKTVHWYLMYAKNMNCVPQREEGFVEAKFVHMDRAVDMARYQDEKRMIQKAIKEYEYIKEKTQK